VPTILGLGVRDDDLVALARTDLVVASGAAIGLLGLVRLYVADLDAGIVVAVGVGPVVLGSHRGNAAQSTSNATTTSALTKSTMSLRRFTC
jgi:hypothetical protein